MNKNSILKTILLALMVTFFVACDNDYNVLGTDIVGVDNFGFGDSKNYDAKTTNLNLGAVESTDLAVNPFGIYDNAVFGETTADYVTQLQLLTPNPAIDLTKNPEIISVVLRVPYFNKLVSTDATGLGTYTLDSIYGPTTYSKMKLKIYESGYFMRDIDPVTQLSQAYYTDQKADFESQLIGNPLNSYISDKSQNDEFAFNNTATQTTTYKYVAGDATSDSTKTNAVPAMKVYLDKAFFNQKILHAPAGKLLNNNVFKDYFRGIYFKIEKGTEPGNLAMLNFKQGIITINYKETTTNTAGVVTNIDYKYIILNMSGKSASLIDQPAPNVLPSPEKLFIKGGANNYMATIDLFNPVQLAEIRSNNWLINDASLTFTIDNATMNYSDALHAQAAQPLRVYLYDINNKRQLLDYALDATPGTTTTKYAKRVFGGIINKDANGRGVSYKIRLTNHIRNIVKNDTVTNVKLGLVVTEDINVITNKNVKNPALGGAIKVIPTMSAIHPLGTVLYGSEATDESKRPVFKVYYTTPK